MEQLFLRWPASIVLNVTEKKKTVRWPGNFYATSQPYLHFFVITKTQRLICTFVITEICINNLEFFWFYNEKHRKVFIYWNNTMS